MPKYVYHPDYEDPIGLLVEEDPQPDQRNGPGRRPDFSKIMRHPGYERRPVFRPSRGEIRPRPPEPVAEPPPTAPRPTRNVYADGEYLSVRKEVFASLIPMGGELWAAFLGRPGLPKPSGDPNVDFANAALHRDALALHDQNRDRIRALTGLAERVVRLMMS